MSDELDNLTPRDPSGMVPDWNDKKRSILTQITATAPRDRRRGWRMLAAAAAVAVVAGGVFVALQFNPIKTVPPAASPTLSREPSGTPSSESTPNSLLAVRTTLFEDDDGRPGLCVGAIGQSYPPYCGLDLIPTSGLEWSDLTSAGNDLEVYSPVTLIGIFDEEVFVVSEIFDWDDPEAPQNPHHDREPDLYLEPLCADPIQGEGSFNPELKSVMEGLPGYQSSWWGSTDQSFHVAVAQDVDGAIEVLRQATEESFCVGSLPGPTHAEVSAARERVMAGRDHLAASGRHCRRLQLHLGGRDRHGRRHPRSRGGDRDLDRARHRS